ncbi:YhhN family protein (macronuclear) [Tetrahymena thermophila SB210]|uniref:YhhN family protein n=1 Tax=Tetrahymena thermophila (strain SB210) TaxID=312017 RepID=Q22P50_TETTS|nr:YhhN family protein [Tetrahymena thermophila SB210]EAR86961.1 YhhN family protein [Tetrahymena thermophila SB210]|eukprot:XP_001007206.1 YhhN family protein [Tetrahymena thermophila SB210]
MSKGQVKESLIKKNQNPAPSIQNKQSTSNRGSTAKVFAHSLIIIFMLLQWAGILLHLPKEYNYITKPSVVLIMFIYTLFQPHYGAKAFKQFMAIGFIFSALGDIFLMFDGQQFFFYGLGSFATAHIAFLVGFLENSSFDTNQFVNFSVPIAVLLFGYGYYMFIFLTSQTGFPEKLKTPVLVYVILISVMCFASSMRDKTSPKSYYLAFIGAIFFVCSDSILSLNMFIPGFKSTIMQFAVMFTYYIAEYLIFVASLTHYSYFKNREHEKKD